MYENTNSRTDFCHFPGTDGKTANEACCACGGGDRGDYTSVPSASPSEQTTSSLSPSPSEAPRNEVQFITNMLMR